MRIIISPAKKMRVDADSIPWKQLPCYLHRTEKLLERLRGMDEAELQRMWKCNDKLTQQNVERVRSMQLRVGLTPAVLSYDGIQYQYMAPSVFTDEEFRYVQEHLRILSGFYGILRPLDGVVPYRLEMQAKLCVDGHKDLYDFWGASIASELFDETDCVVNLASKEYSRCVSDYLPPSVRMITCIFGEKVNGKLVEKGTMCKMARGAMVRFMAERNIEEAEDIKNFHGLGFTFSELDSGDDRFVFLRRVEEDENENSDC